MYQRFRKDHADLFMSDFQISEALGLDDLARSTRISPQPSISCCFIDDSKIFVTLFHSHYSLHYHLIYDDKKRQVFAGHQHQHLEGRGENYPQKAFYNPEEDEIYIFYR